MTSPSRSRIGAATTAAIVSRLAVTVALPSGLSQRVLGRWRTLFRT